MGLNLPPANHFKGYSPTGCIRGFALTSGHENDEVSVGHPLLTQPCPASEPSPVPPLAHGPTEQPARCTSTTRECDGNRTSPPAFLKTCQWEVAFPCPRGKLGQVPGPFCSLVGHKSHLKS